MKLHVIWVADHITFSTLEHTHDYYQLCYVRKEGGFFEISGRHFEALPNHVYFMKPMEPHLMQRGNGMRLIEIKFLADDEETTSQLDVLPPCFPLGDDFSQRLLIKDVVTEGLSHEPYCNESSNSALQLLLIRCVRGFLREQTAPDSLDNFNEVLPPEEKNKGRDYDVRFIQLLSYINKHLAERITLDDLVSLAHFNKSYLVERFKNMWGISPIKYVNLMRLERAKQLLQTTDLSITAIARETGFQSIHYFSRYFKSNEQMTPQQYRARYADKELPEEKPQGAED